MSLTSFHPGFSTSSGIPLCTLSTQCCLASASSSVHSGPDCFFIFFDFARLFVLNPSSNPKYSPIRVSQEQFVPLICLLFFSAGFDLFLGFGWRFLPRVSHNILQRFLFFLRPWSAFNAWLGWPVLPLLVATLVLRTIHSPPSCSEMHLYFPDQRGFVRWDKYFH